jgi:dimethylhistidine N-methyltransferase
MSESRSQQIKPVRMFDLAPTAVDLREEVLTGLQKPVKELPCKLFYDQRGSRLFHRITQLPEYYPTRTEMELMANNIDEMAALLGRRTLLIEYGSGSGEKTRILLDHLQEPAAYVPIDISRGALLQSAEATAESYPGLEVLAVCADYNQPFTLPQPESPVSRRVVYYPGSTIGNFHPHDALDFLKGMGVLVGPAGGLLIGVDLKKNHEVLHAAYNDSEGVTAAFNCNILVRLNRELGMDFRMDRFRHRAIYNDDAGRIEMHLVSLVEQTVRLDGTEIPFRAGESIWTESSYKYAVDDFSRMAAGAGFAVEKVWIDDKKLFSVQYLTAATPGKSG